MHASAYRGRIAYLCSTQRRPQLVTWTCGYYAITRIIYIPKSGDFYSTQVIEILSYGSATMTVLLLYMKFTPDASD